MGKTYSHILTYHTYKGNKNRALGVITRFGIKRHYEAGMKIKNRRSDKFKEKERALSDLFHNEEI